MELQRSAEPRARTPPAPRRRTHLLARRADQLLGRGREVARAHGRDAQLALRVQLYVRQQLSGATARAGGRWGQACTEHGWYRAAAACLLATSAPLAPATSPSPAHLGLSKAVPEAAGRQQVQAAVGRGRQHLWLAVAVEVGLRARG